MLQLNILLDLLAPIYRDNNVHLITVFLGPELSHTCAHLQLVLVLENIADLVIGRDVSLAAMAPIPRRGVLPLPEGLVLRIFPRAIVDGLFDLHTVGKKL